MRADRWEKLEHEARTGWCSGAQVLRFPFLIPQSMIMSTAMTRLTLGHSATHSRRVSSGELLRAHDVTYAVLAFRGKSHLGSAKCLFARHDISIPWPSSCPPPRFPWSKARIPSRTSIWFPRGHFAGSPHSLRRIIESRAHNPAFDKLNDSHMHSSALSSMLLRPRPISSADSSSRSIEMTP